MELDSVLSFYSYYKNDHDSSNFEPCDLINAITLSNHNRKPLILYLHLNDDEFSKFFCRLLHDEELSKYFIIHPWDLTERKFDEVLFDACKIYLHYDVILRKIKQHETAVFVFDVDDDNKGRLCNFFDGDSEQDSVRAELLDIKNESVKNNLVERVGALNTFLETSIQLKSTFITSLKDAREQCKLEEKLLLIYLHKANGRFTNKFCALLKNTHINDIFSYFVLYACDVNSVTEEIENLYLDEVNWRVNKSENGIILLKPSNEEELKFEEAFTGNIKDEENFIFQLYNAYMRFEEEKQNYSDFVEKQAVLSFVTNFEMSYGLIQVPFVVNTLQKAIENILLAESNYLQKVLVLYYHNEDDLFSREFTKILSEGSTKDTLGDLENLFCFLPWNIGDRTFNKVLKTVVRNHFDLELMEEFIDDGKGGLFFFVSNQSKPCFFTHLSGHFDMDLMRNVFNQIQEVFQESHEITEVAELDATKNFIDQYDLSAQYRHTMSLNDVIKEKCLTLPVNLRKMLLFYYHNSEDEFSKTFINLIETDEKIQELTKEHFHFLAWDITDERLHPALTIAIKRYFDIEMMEKLLKIKKSGLFLFSPCMQSLPLYSYVHKGVSRNNLYSVLYKAKEDFVKEQIIESKLENIDSEGPVQFQQIIFDQLGDRNWDCFKLYKDEGEYLKEKISFGFYGTPDEEQLKNTDSKMKKLAKKRKEHIEEVYKKIIAQVAEFGMCPNEISMTCVFNCITPLPKKKMKKINKDKDYNPMLDFTILPIFIIRKCVRSPSKNPCRIFIDHDLRVYTTWNDYLNKNKLPEGIFIVPKNGKYCGDMWGNVRVEYRLSPACGLGPAILLGVDIGSTIVGVGAGILGGIATIPALAIAPGVMIGATVVGAGIGIYTIARSSYNIYDRVVHNESMSILNSKARGTYFGILAGALGFTGSGINAVSYFASNGVTLAMVARGSIASANLLVGGSAVINSTYEVIHQWATDEEPDLTVAIQLSKAILFFGHSIYIVQENDTIDKKQIMYLKQIQASLRSNRHRKDINLLTRSGKKNQNEGNVMHSLIKLNHNTEILDILIRATGRYNEQGVPICVCSDEINFNGNIIHITEVHNMSRIQQSDYLINMPRVIESTPLQIKLTQQLIEVLFFNGNISEELSKILKERTFQAACANYLNVFSNYVQLKLLLYLKYLLEYICEETYLYKTLQILYVPTQQPIKIINSLMNFFKGKVVEEEKKFVNNIYSKNPTDCTESFCKRKKVNRIVYFMEKAVIYSHINNETTLSELRKHLQAWFVRKIYENRFKIETQETSVMESSKFISTKKEVECPDCKGFYYVDYK